MLVSEEQKERFRKEPETYLQYRKEVEHELNCRFKFVCIPVAVQAGLCSNIKTRFFGTALSKPKLFASQQMK